MSSRTTRARQHDAAAEQPELPLELSPLLPSGEALRALDLFAGIGGLSAGFAQAGFSMVGADSEPVAGEVYEKAGFGTARLADLGQEMVRIDVPVIIGGPPCRPWSPVNLQRRRHHHDDHTLLVRFMDHVAAIRPLIFVMENVPALAGDDLYVQGVADLRSAGYDVAAQVLHYDQFGAATRRRRLFTVGVRGSPGAAQTFFRLLREQHAPARTVGEAIQRFAALDRGEFPDHDWSRLRSIGNYRQRYESGQFGWRRLEYDAPAPSFGSVAKTYILHPESGRSGFPERVLSVREVMAITGFDDEVQFPTGTARARRYQMVANAVSPQVSWAVALTTVRLLRGGSATIPAG